jgi:hypothetical protein
LRSNSQSPPPGSARPFSFGPSKVPPLTSAMRRWPNGVAPRSLIRGTSSRAWNRNSVSMPDMVVSPPVVLLQRQPAA